MPKVKDIRPMMGCDPEFFFTHKSEGIIGAEKVLPKKGLKAGLYDIDSKFVIDGVQAELNPKPESCRAFLANEIAACFRQLGEELKNKGEGVGLDFSCTVIIPKKNLMELDEKSRQFGCAPSKSIYNALAGIRLGKVDPEKYRVRAAGGHIHIGVPDFYDDHETSKGIKRALKKDYEKTVAMLDLICGNTSVLIDRDEGNVERRKVYGKAGEFRLPKHGLEYRTLSNYWLHAYPLMSFAFAMARLAVQLIADERHEEFFSEFTSKVKPKKIRDAINKNDFDLAMENFKNIEPLLLETTPATQNYAVHKDNVIEFHHFVKNVNKNGLQHYFPDDPLTHWTNLKEAHSGGFHDFLVGNVRREMKKEEKKQAA